MQAARILRLYNTHSQLFDRRKNFCKMRQSKSHRVGDERWKFTIELFDVCQMNTGVIDFSFMHENQHRQGRARARDGTKRRIEWLRIRITLNCCCVCVLTRVTSSRAGWSGCCSAWSAWLSARGPQSLQPLALLQLSHRSSMCASRSLFEGLYSVVSCTPPPISPSPPHGWV